MPEEMSKPSDRILIKTVLKNDKHALKIIQGKPMPGIFKLNFWLRFYLILVNVLSGCFSGFTVVNAKMCIEITSKKAPQDLFTDPMWYLTFVLMATMIISNLANLNQTISLYSQLLVMPTYECCIICGTLMAGGIVMNEFTYYTSQQLCLIFMGSLIAICGILYKVCVLEAEDIQQKTLTEMSTDCAVQRHWDEAVESIKRNQMKSGLLQKLIF